MNALQSVTPVLLALVLFLLCACQDEGEPTGVKLEFDINKTVIQLRSPGDLQFTDGFITITEVVFDGDQVDGASVSISHSRTVVYDFASGASEPADDVIEIPAGTYNDIYLGIELLDENDDPTMVLEGTYEKSDGQIYPVRFEFNSGEVFEAEAARGVVQPNTTAIAKITFDPQKWFARVRANRMENAKVNADGVIVISETSNAGIFDLVADGLDRATDAVFQ